MRSSALQHTAAFLVLPSSLYALTPSTVAKKMSMNAVESESMYKPYRKYPKLFGDDFEESWLHPDMLEIVEAFSKAGPDADPARISSLVHEEVDEVYSFRCLSDDFLQKFNEELQNFNEMSERHDIPVRRPNSSKSVGLDHSFEDVFVHNV
jgi:hypothetical protein